MPRIELLSARDFQRAKHPDGSGVRKEFVPELKVSAGDRRIEFTITTGSVDRDHDAISPKGWELEAWEKNPVVLFAHQHREPPVAKGIGIRKTRSGLVAEAEFTSHDLYPFGHMIFRMYQEGFLRATSVGFRPIEWERSEDEERKGGIDFTKQELLEFSAVPVPANAEALMRAHDLGIDTEPLREWAEKMLDLRQPLKGLCRDDLEKAWDVLSKDAIVIDLGETEPIFEPDVQNGIEVEMALEEAEEKASLERKAQRVQSLVFSKKSWTRERAVAWARDHDFKNDKVDETGQSYRLRQFDPSDCDGGFQTLTENFPEGISAVSCNVAGAEIAPPAEEGLDKGAISYAQAHAGGTPVAPTDTEWNGPGEIAAAEVSDLRVICAWVETASAESKGAYKLPHHRAEGEHAVVWRGVTAAMAVLLGARGGVDIPANDRRAVYNHLAKHYRDDFDMEPPAFRFVEAQVLEHLADRYDLDAETGALQEISPAENAADIIVDTVADLTLLLQDGVRLDADTVERLHDALVTCANASHALRSKLAESFSDSHTPILEIADDPTPSEPVGDTIEVSEADFPTFAKTLREAISKRLGRA